MAHEITWEDAKMVGFTCGESGAEMSLAVEHAPEACSVCGKKLRLIWDVRIVEEP